MQPGIVGFKDFVMPSARSMNDYADNKHGTEMAGWVMNIMPLAKVYVARVLYGDKSGPTSGNNKTEDDCIIEVIEHNLLQSFFHSDQALSLQQAI
jgi:hypothetical protein